MLLLKLGSHQQLAPFVCVMVLIRQSKKTRAADLVLCEYTPSLKCIQLVLNEMVPYVWMIGIAEHQFLNQLHTKESQFGNKEWNCSKLTDRCLNSGKGKFSKKVGDIHWLLPIVTKYCLSNSVGGRNRFEEAAQLSAARWLRVKAIVVTCSPAYLAKVQKACCH